MPTILITGATAGIGLALARLYHNSGQRLILIGRKPLPTLQDSLFSAETYIAADLSQPDCIAKITHGLRERGVATLDLVIHNAGIGYMGAIGEQSAEAIAELLTVNLITPIKLTHALLPHLQKARGKLVFISSVVSKLAAPNFATYAASKAALDGFARSLRVELQGQVAVQVIHPGATRTSMHAKVGMSPKKYRRFVSAEKVARKIATAIESKRRAVIIGTSNKIIRTLGALSDPLQRIGKGKPAPRQSAAPLHCIITGAADGIGRALALRYAQAGYRITGIDFDKARSATTAAELRAKGADVTFIVADLVEDLSWVERLDAADVFIHNAGISATGHFATLDPDQQARVIRLNLLAPLQITAQLIAKELINNGAALLFISSLSKFVSYPSATAYAASKDGLANYARSVSVALHPHTHVLTIYPGPTRTAHARRYSPDNSREASRMSPTTLAEKIYQAQQAKKRTLLPAAGPKLFAALGILTPRLMELAMRKLLFDKK